jgi:hypothetical protein
MPDVMFAVSIKSEGIHVIDFHVQGINIVLDGGL